MLVSSAMDFELPPQVEASRTRAEALGRALGPDAAAAAVVHELAVGGWLAGAPTLLPLVVAIEALALSAPAAAVMLAVQATVLEALCEDPQWAPLLREGRVVGGMELSSEAMPQVEDGYLTGRVMWVAPVTAGGVVLVAARLIGPSADGDASSVEVPEPPHEGSMTAYAVALEARGVTVRPETVSGLGRLACASLDLAQAPARPVGAPAPIMARMRLGMAAVGLGIGARALTEALAAVRVSGGHDAEAQTVQGLLAEAATDLEAARLLTRSVAASAATPSLGLASAAKLAATAAALGAVERASQVVGIDSFRDGHILERLARDVRALELWAGRTEALRAAVAADVLPPGRALDLAALHEPQPPTA